MLKRILSYIICIIIIYQIYLNYTNTNDKIDIIPITDYDKEVRSEGQQNIITPKQEIISLEYYGPAHRSGYDKEGPVHIWDFNEIVPWSRIILKPNSGFPLYYFLKVEVPSLNDYQQWKEIIPNLEFDARERMIIIPAKDEEGALAVANLMVNNFKGTLPFDHIIERNLIPISVSKAKAYPMIKNKLREQIINNLVGNTMNNAEFETDLATTQVPDRPTSPAAFGGNEYSFITDL